MTGIDELLPCLKCKADEGQAYANDGWFGVECNNCAHTTGTAYRSAEEAIAKWNAGREKQALRSSFPQKEEVGVKPLEWVLVKPNYWRAITPFGTFEVVAQPCFGKPWRTFTPTDWRMRTGDTADELKVLTEADYRSRILSALVQP